MAEPPHVNFFWLQPPSLGLKKGQNILNLMCATTRIDPQQLNCHIMSLISHNQIVLILGSNQERLSIQEDRVSGTMFLTYSQSLYHTLLLS